MIRCSRCGSQWEPYWFKRGLCLRCQADDDYAASSIFCEHANEVPAVCPCEQRCYCKANTCAKRDNVEKSSCEELDPRERDIGLDLSAEYQLAMLTEECQALQGIRESLRPAVTVPSAEATPRSTARQSDIKNVRERLWKSVLRNRISSLFLKLSDLMKSP